MAINKKGDFEIDTYAKIGLLAISILLAVAAIGVLVYHLLNGTSFFNNLFRFK